MRFYDRRERDYIIYLHNDVNLDGWGWACCCSTFDSWKRKVVALLLEIEATWVPLSFSQWCITCVSHKSTFIVFNLHAHSLHCKWKCLHKKAQTWRTMCRILQGNLWLEDILWKWPQKWEENSPWSYFRIDGVSMEFFSTDMERFVSRTESLRQVNILLMFSWTWCYRLNTKYKKIKIKPNCLVFLHIYTTIMILTGFACVNPILHKEFKPIIVVDNWLEILAS